MAKPGLRRSEGRRARAVSKDASSLTEVVVSTVKGRVRFRGRMQME